MRSIGVRSQKPFLILPEKTVRAWSALLQPAGGRLLNPHKMPPKTPPLSAADGYRFVLSTPGVDVCTMGASNREEMHDNLKVLDKGPLIEEELETMRKIGDHLH